MRCSLLDLKRANLEAYLKGIYGRDLTLTSTRKMGETIATTEDVKGFGYGSPLLVEYEAKGKKGSAVISSMRVQRGFGHDHFSDRARIMIWQNSAFNHLPKHVRSLDVGYFTEKESWSRQATLANTSCSWRRSRARSTSSIWRG